MIKVLIADDESAVHDQLRKLIPWDELGWEIVGHAFNGEEARRLAELYRPHLVLTDIKMPIMDGLSFMKWLDESDMTIKIIVLSGYGNFDYSRSAFLLGAYDYLLKPIKEAELLMTLSKAVDQIQKDTRSQADRINDKAVLSHGITLMRDEFISSSIMMTKLEENELIVRAEQLFITLPEASYVVVVIKFPDMDEHVNQRFEGDRNLFYFAVRNIMNESLGQDLLIHRNLHRTSEFVFIYPSKDRSASILESSLKRLKVSLAQYMRIQCIIGVSSWMQRLGKLPAAYAEALHSSETIELSFSNPLAYYGKTEQPNRDTSTFTPVWSELISLTETLLATGALRDGERLIIILEIFTTKLIRHMSVAEWKRAITELLDKLERGTVIEETLLLVHDARAGAQELRINQVHDLLRKLMEALLHSSQVNPKAKKGKQLIDSIKAYIDTHYQTVSLDDISQQFFLNKNYFCSLFKGVTGESFMEYLISQRMEHAKRLLTDSDLKTYEIAERVGYNDQRYFSQVFRKYSGMQPTQYRQKEK